jgi:hypothetical protein
MHARTTDGAHRQRVQQQLALQQDPAFRETENERIGLLSNECVSRTALHYQSVDLVRRFSVYWYKSACFTGTKVHILTPEQASLRIQENYAGRKQARRRAGKGDYL